MPGSMKLEMSRRERRVVSLLVDILGAEIVEWNPPTSFRPEGWEGDAPVVEAAPPPAVVTVPFKKTKSAIKKTKPKSAAAPKKKTPKKDNNQGEML